MACPSNQVPQALTASNTNVSAGFMIDQRLGIPGHRSRPYGTPEDIAAAVVAAVDGVPIRVSDLGERAHRCRPQAGEGSINAQPGVILGVQNNPGANTLDLDAHLRGSPR